MAMIRPDFIFSYWILAWFLWYYLVMIYGNHSYLPPNPTVAIWIALIQNVLHLVSMILDHPRWIIVVAYVFVIGLMSGHVDFNPHDQHIWQDDGADAPGHQLPRLNINQRTPDIFIAQNESRLETRPGRGSRCIRNILPLFSIEWNKRL